jgi:peroxiredoxin
MPATVMAWPQPGDPAPSVMLSDTALVPHTIPGDYAGQILHLFFWKSVDSTCLAEMPRLQAMYADYGSQGYEPLAINVLEDMDSVVKVYARQYTYGFLLDDASAWIAYRMGGYIPLNYVIDTTGLVINSMEGFDESTIRGWVESVLPGVSETHSRPLELLAIGANPAVGRSAVRFNLPKAANVTLRVYSTSGALVRTLVSGQMPAGANSVSWNLQDNSGRKVGNGLYLYELNTGLQVAHAKVSVLK